MLAIYCWIRWNLYFDINTAMEAMIMHVKLASITSAVSFWKAFHFLLFYLNSKSSAVWNIIAFLVCSRQIWISVQIERWRFFTSFATCLFILSMISSLINIAVCCILSVQVVDSLQIRSAKCEELKKIILCYQMLESVLSNQWAYHFVWFLPLQIP